MADTEAKWYVVHTYSGYENKVTTDLEKTIENQKLQDSIMEVAVPLEEVVEIKNGVRKVSQRKLFPGYVLIHMIWNDDTWYVVRNTRGVTGFVGPGGELVALTPEELARMGIISASEAKLEFAVGDMIQVISGVWAGTEGKIEEINESKQTVTIMMDLFGRDTPVDLSFTEVKKVND